MSLPVSIKHTRQDLRWFWTLDKAFLFIFVAVLVVGFFAITFTSNLLQ